MESFKSENISSNGFQSACIAENLSHFVSLVTTFRCVVIVICLNLQVVF